MKKLAVLILVIFTFNIGTSFANSFLDNIKKYEQKKYAPNPVQIMEAWKKKKRQLIKEIYEQTNISSLMDL
jgi:hypothetical protein